MYLVHMLEVGNSLASKTQKSADFVLDVEPKSWRGLEACQRRPGYPP